MFRTTLVLLAITSIASAQTVLVEAESFENHGGWKLDTQFIEIMGSPYLLAHGLGRSVKDATTKITFPKTGRYRVFVRTKDWVAHWGAKGTPGRFQLLVNGTALKTTFGTEGAEWHWQDGGLVSIDKDEVTLGLHDLTGFDGRCDAICFVAEGGDPPPNEGDVLGPWRRTALGLPEKPESKGKYDLVVVGGGYSGVGAAISAARMGCKVALIQNRPVLGGNGSSEVRVWAMGNIRRGKFPRIGEIVEEFCDHAKKSPGTYQEFEDDKKETIVKAEQNIDLFLNHHAFKVDGSSNLLEAIYAFDTRTSAVRKFTGRLFCDATGHGTIGHLAKADSDMTPKGRMGMSNMWAWGEGDDNTAFPKTPWALDLEMKDFPYPRDHHGQWFWEGGFDKDPITEAELIRDWNLRAVYGAFNAMKNRDGATKHKTAFLTWIAYIGGPRESRRLMGDVVLNEEDIVTKREFKDGCVPSTWSIDLHYPRKQYSKKFPDNPFISIAEHDRRVDRSYGYPVPYRCFYSKNINNLFMAGRCVSVTHKALGTVRVMKTCGMMGEVVGKAASVCTIHDCYPREVYTGYWGEMERLLKLPGKARRKTVDSPIEIPKDAMKLAGPYGPMDGLDPAKLSGIVVDDREAKKTGKWGKGTGLKGFVGFGYRYASNNSGCKYEFAFKAPASGEFEIRIATQPHENRGNRVPVTVAGKTVNKTVRVNMKEKPALADGFTSLGKYTFLKDEAVTVTIDTKDAGGTVHADAIQVLAVK